jgi:hypothetical protein
MKHRGEIIEKAVRESGFPITKLAKKVGRSARWIYLIFKNPNVPIDTVLQISHIIHYDFSTEIPELIRFTTSPVNHYPVKESNPAFHDARSEAEHWKNKYLELLEAYNKLLVGRDE